MTPASALAMPRCISAAVMAFPATARAGDRRNVRFFKPLAACGEDDQPPSMAAVPASLRAIQAKRKLAAAWRGVPRAAATSAAECAVAALVKVVGVVHGAAAGGAVAWVFSKVQFHSSELAIGLLGMFAYRVGKAVEMEAERARATTQAKQPEPSDNEDPETDHDVPVVTDVDLSQLIEDDKEKARWASIGIMHGGQGGYKDMFKGLNENVIKEINSPRERRRMAAYERVIVTGGANSLILSNYAQLLYEIDNDMERAEMYFKQALVAKPADSEAKRRYAMFLWHVRGDLSGAEDMFTAAIDEEPKSSHITSNYACFLWMTGGADTCLLDDSEKNDDDDDE